jgi:hypothetical protein
MTRSIAQFLLLASALVGGLGEVFNLANHPNPNGLVTQFGNRAFGQVNSFATPRYFQVSGRVSW